MACEGVIIGVEPDRSVCRRSSFHMQRAIDCHLALSLSCLSSTRCKFVPSLQTRWRPNWILVIDKYFANVHLTAGMSLIGQLFHRTSPSNFT